MRSIQLAGVVLKRKIQIEDLLEVADRLVFEPHRTPVDQTGRYDEPPGCRVSLLIQLFHFRHNDVSPNLTRHERLEVLIPLDGAVCMRMPSRQVDVSAGEILIVENMKLLNLGVFIVIDAEMAIKAIQLSPKVQPVPQHLLDKHYKRKHGVSA
jgi:hypothetical protein